MSDRKEALERAIKAVGGLAGIAGPLGISMQAVSQWDEVPPLRVLKVEEISGVPRHELRPDLYPLEEARA
jgi:DNA-binding transcriptional regulator YdaS (Cro superfamily)